jgi:hypothetical protein
MDQAYEFVDKFLEEAIRSSSTYDSRQNAEYEYQTTDHYAHATFSISNSSRIACMKVPFLLEKYHIGILDGGADTCVLGKGWKVLSFQDSKRENIIGCDHEAAVKRNLPIVSAITEVDLPDGSFNLLVVHEGIYNDTGNHILLLKVHSEYSTVP